VTHQRLANTGARVLGLLAFLIIASTVVWSAATLSGTWLSDFRSVTDLTPTRPGTTEVVGTSAATVEPEDFIGIGFVAMLGGLGVAGVVGTWRSRPGWVLLVALAVLAFAVVSLWSIGFFVAPAGLLLLVAAATLFASTWAGA
jgi:hypothetical protein